MRKEIKKQLQTIMDQAVKDNQIAGMNMMVIKDGQEEAYLQCGYADKANGKMIERDTIFRLFSMTKIFSFSSISFAGKSFCILIGIF